MTRTHRFGIGTTFRKGGRDRSLWTVTDLRTTYNAKGEPVKIGYVAAHELMGIPVTDYDVIETTIARGLVTATEPHVIAPKGGAQ